MANGFILDGVVHVVNTIVFSQMICMYHFFRKELESDMFSSVNIIFGLHQSALGFKICRVRSDGNPEHTYLARRSTMIMKVVPLG